MICEFLTSTPQVVNFFFIIFIFFSETTKPTCLSNQKKNMRELKIDFWIPIFISPADTFPSLSWILKKIEYSYIFFI